MEEENKSVEIIPEEKIEKNYSEKEYNDLKIQLDTAKNEATDYKQKLEKSENDRKDFEHKTKINNFVKSLGLKNDIYENHVANLILEKGLKFDGENLTGGDEIVNDFKEKYPNAFKSAQPVPEFSVSTTGQGVAKDDDAFVRKVMGLK